MDHDQRFKNLIKVFFREFLLLFFASWAERLDLGAVTWLEQEVFPDPPGGPRRALDLVGRVATHQAVEGQRTGEPDSFVALVHIEIESPDKAAPLRPRMFRSYVYLRDKYSLPVLPIALYLKVGLDGIGIDIYEELFSDFRPVRFEYLYVGLPALDAVEYVQGENWLGVALAALMRIPKDRVAWLGAEALRRLQAAPLTDQKRFLLAECVQAYLQLDEQQQREYEQLIATEPYGGVRAMNATWFEKGIEKGIEKERREWVRTYLELRFGPLPGQVETRLQEMSARKLESVRDMAMRATSLEDLALDEGSNG
jgi:hypothetical protein